jgi:type II secretory pathway pseudopilin PulG
MRIRKHETGMSMVEVLAALAIVGTMIMASVVATSMAHKMTRTNTDKEFATQKAISILEEMKGLVQVNSGGNAITLDTFDDGAQTSPILTIQGTHRQVGDTRPLTQPDDSISGNVLVAPSKWRFERHITVTTPPGQTAANDVRLVDVQVYRNGDGGRVLLAEVSSVIRTIIDSMPPTQVYDVYLIAVENVPGWWVYMSNVVKVVNNAITNLQSRNPGLEFRTHQINTLAYGRDQMYRPYINDAVDSEQNIEYAYFYPGKMPDPAANADVGNNYYYFPEFFRGHILVSDDSSGSVQLVDKNGYDVDKNPFPYAIADQYNHAMRYWDEKALYDLRKGENPKEEMSLRLLLDDMYMHPDQYVNALVINLHGELMPFPPIRNYSDAAKDPEQTAAPDLRNVRVVTHPEQLRYPQVNGTVNFRVYSYLTNPDAAGLNNLPAATPITLIVKGTNAWAPAAGSITTITGGVDNAGNPVAYASGNAAVCGAVPPAAGTQCYTWGLTGTGNADTIIKLYNSPLRSPFDTATGLGLDYASRLYGMEYIPSPVEDLSIVGAQVPFTNNLATSAAPLPKNTARWILRIPTGSCPANGRISVDTRIGDQVTSGVVYPTPVQPANLSRTYTYRGTDQWIFGDLTNQVNFPPNLPISERYQFQGDPRHCPYSDLKRPYTGTTATPANESTLGMGYNRNFDNFEDATYNGTSFVQLIGANAAATYNITAANNTVALKVNNVAITNFTVTTGGARTAAQIVTNMNANAGFTAVAIADVVNGHVRIMPRTQPLTVQFTPATGTIAGPLGFDNITRTNGAWVGWSYTNAAGTQRYGVKNNSSLVTPPPNAGAAGWITGAGDHDTDVARIFQITRSALIRSNALWTSMTGWSYYYVGLGNEIGYDAANGFQYSIPVSRKPFDGTSGSWWHVDTITRDTNGAATPANQPTSQGTYYVRTGGGPAAGWWSIPWLGELYPDQAYDVAAGIDWKNAGNLATDNTNANGWYVRDLRQNFPRFPGTDLEQTVRRTYRMGCTTMFWGNTAASTFHHQGGTSPDTGTIQTMTPGVGAGRDIADHYAFPVPDTMDSNRPFTTAETTAGDNPEFFLQNAYPQAGNSVNGGANVTTGTAANNARLLNSYYLHNTSKQASALLTLSDPTTFNTAFIVVNGLSPTGISGTTFISNWAFLSLIQSYLNGGLYTDASAQPTAQHIRQLPRVAITAPNVTTNLKNPSSVNVTWAATWKRWDDIPYTTAYPNNYSETGVNITYQVMYSSTNGFPPDPVNRPLETGWRFVQTDAIAHPGELSLNVAQEQVTGTSATWNTPAGSFPEANYLIRVEAYRNGFPKHYSYHQYRAYISR